MPAAASEVSHSDEGERGIAGAFSSSTNDDRRQLTDAFRTAVT